MRCSLIAIGFVLALPGTAAVACGYCVEDKVAAVYDDAVVTQALGRKHYVAFFALDGALTPDDGTRRALAALAQSARGADKDGVRVSVESAALSVAFDPQRVPLAEMQRALARKFAAKKLTVLPLRVLEAPGKLKPVDGR